MKQLGNEWCFLFYHLMGWVTSFIRISNELTMDVWLVIQSVFFILLHGNDCKVTNVSIEIQHHIYLYYIRQNMY